MIRYCFILMVPFSSCKDENKDLEEAGKQYDSIVKVLEHEGEIKDSLLVLLEKGEKEREHKIYFGKGFKGIEDPQGFIISILKSHPEEIPLKPVLGGTMEFRHVKVLSEDWVFAQYDDGHVQGQTIYSYSLKPNGELGFKMVASQNAP